MDYRDKILQHNLLMVKSISDNVEKTFHEEVELIEKTRGVKVPIGTVVKYRDGSTWVKHHDGWISVKKDGKGGTLYDSSGKRHEKHSEDHSKFATEAYRKHTESSKEEKGGKVIGKTSSGKEVFEGKDPSEYKDFTPQDHRDAVKIHKEYETKKEKDGDDQISVYSKMTTSQFRQHMIDEGIKSGDKELADFYKNASTESVERRRRSAVIEDAKKGGNYLNPKQETVISKLKEKYNSEYEVKDEGFGIFTVKFMNGKVHKLDRDGKEVEDSKESHEKRGFDSKKGDEDITGKSEKIEKPDYTRDKMKSISDLQKKYGSYYETRKHGGDGSMTEVRFKNGKYAILDEKGKIVNENGEAVESKKKVDEVNIKSENIKKLDSLISSEMSKWKSRLDENGFSSKHEFQKKLEKIFTDAKSNISKLIDKDTDGLKFKFLFDGNLESSSSGSQSFTPQVWVGIDTSDVRDKLPKLMDAEKEKGLGVHDSALNILYDKARKMGVPLGGSKGWGMSKHFGNDNYLPLS